MRNFDRFGTARLGTGRLGTAWLGIDWFGRRSAARVLATVALCVALLAPAETKAVPDILNYSGYLTNGAGEAIDCADPDACLRMSFRLYVQPDNGEPVWEEAFDNVPVQGGVFHVLLGDAEPLYVEGLGVGDVWLGVQIEDNPEMTPRQRIASSLFAVFAAEADTCGDAQTLGGESPDSFVQVLDLSPVATSGNYADLVGAPDLEAFTLQVDLEAHAGTADAHHARYADEEAVAAVGPHFSGAYADLAGAPDLSVFATFTDLDAYATLADVAGLASEDALGSHAADAAAHHVRYGDEEAIAAVGPHFSGNYEDLAGAPDLTAYASDDSLQQFIQTYSDHENLFVEHAEDEAAHHARYTDAEAVGAVGPHFSGSYGDLAGVPDLAVYATDADLAGHAGAADAHHARYTDGEAVEAVGPHFSGSYGDLAGVPDLAVYATDADLAGHAGAADAHHARYTDAEAVEAVGPHFSGSYGDLAGVPDLAVYATDADLAGHAGAADAHHARYTDAEAVEAVGPHFSGSYGDLAGAPDLTGFLTGEDLGPYATDADLAGHAGAADAHHARYTDVEAVEAVGPHFSGSYGDLAGAPDLTGFLTGEDLGPYATDADLAGHAGAADAHHARYTDVEAVEAVGPHFSGSYGDLAGAPDLTGFLTGEDLGPYATDADLAGHAGAADAHHARYTDEEAVTAVGPHFSGSYGDLAGAPDLTGFLTGEDLGPYATDADLAGHAGVADAHHARYTDEEAVTAVGPHFSGNYGDLAGAPDLTGFLTGEDLGPYATDADLAGHAGAADAHHARYTDEEAVTAVGPHFSGNYGDLAGAPDLTGFLTGEDLGPYAMDADIVAHSMLPSVHHARFTPAEAIAAVGPHFSGVYGDLVGAPDLNVYATDADLGVHAQDPAAHHTRYTDSEARAAVGPVFSGDYDELANAPLPLSGRAVALKRWYAARDMQDDVVYGCAFPVAMESDGDYVYTLCDEEGAGLYAHEVATGRRAYVTYLGCSNPGDLTLDGHSIWVTCVGNGGMVMGVATETGQPFDGVMLPDSFDVRGVAFDGRRLWMADYSGQQLVAWDLTLGRLVFAIPLDAPPIPVAFDGTNVWTATVAGTFTVVDASSGGVRGEGRFEGLPDYLVWTGRFMWLTHGSAAAGTGFASALDLAAGGPRFQSVLPSGWSPGQAAFDGRNIWVTDRSNARLRVLDGWTGQFVRDVGGGQGSYVGAAFDGARLWVGNVGTGLVQF